MADNFPSNDIRHTGIFQLAGGRMPQGVESQVAGGPARRAAEPVLVTAMILVVGPEPGFRDEGRKLARQGLSLQIGQIREQRGIGLV